MNYKYFIGVIAGVVSWWVAFFLIGYSLALMIPPLREAGRAVMYDNDYSLLTTPYLVGAIFVYCLINPLAGWITVRISKNLQLTLVAAIPLTAYAIAAHWFRLWGILPDWYNILVVIMIPPLMYLGGYMIQTSNK